MFSHLFHRNFYVAATLFIATGAAALLLEEPWLIAVPFVLVLVQPAVHFIIEQPRLLYFILFATLPVSTEYNLTPSLGFDFPDELLMGAITLLFVLKMVYKPGAYPKSTLQHPLLLLLFLHLGWVLVSCLYAQDVLLSFKFLLAKTWFIVPFVLIPVLFFNSKKAIKTLALLLLLPMGFVVVQCLLRHAFYGFSFEGIKATLSPFFRNHVTYSAMLACLLAVLWVMHKLTPATNKYKLLLTTGLWIGAIALVLAWSRGAWLAILAGFVAWYCIKKNVLGWLIVLAASSTIASTAWLATDKHYLRFAPDFKTTIYHEALGEHLQATVTLQDVSNAERFYRWVAAANMVADKPVIGFGPNNFYNHYRRYTVAPFRTWVSNNPERSSVHNYFLLTLLEQGVPGLVFFCALYFAMLLYSQRLYRQLHDPFYKTIAHTIGIVLIMIGTLIFISDLVETDKIGSMFWLCLGMLLVLQQKLEGTLIKD